MEDNGHTDAGLPTGSPVYPQLRAMRQDIDFLKEEMGSVKEEIQLLRKDLERFREDLVSIGASASSMANLMARQVEVQGMSYANLDERMKKLEEDLNQLQG